MAAVRVERAAGAAGAEGLVEQEGSAAGTVEEEREVGAMVEGVMEAEEMVEVERERRAENRSSSPRCAVYGRAREARALRIRQQRPGS